ncbi:MAG TPA: hypothetical protein GX710_06720 [Clostridiales bacterium]|nr:hypothetical protein [Clostridiales bacterium]
MKLANPIIPELVILILRKNNSITSINAPIKTPVVPAIKLSYATYSGLGLLSKLK